MTFINETQENILLRSDVKNYLVTLEQYLIWSEIHGVYIVDNSISSVYRSLSQWILQKKCI